MVNLFNVGMRGYPGDQTAKRLIPHEFDRHRGETKDTLTGNSLKQKCINSNAHPWDFRHKIVSCGPTFSKQSNTQGNPAGRCMTSEVYCRCIGTSICVHVSIECQFHLATCV